MTAFSPTSGTISVGAPVTVTLDNQDAGVSHDLVFYDPSGTQIASTDIIQGPATATLAFTPAVPGTYAYNCTVHPRQMNGALTAQ
jgi:plastocyanin